MIRFLLPAFLFAHGVPSAFFVEHLHTGGDGPHTHDLGALGLAGGVLERTLAAVVGGAGALHLHRHGSAAGWWTRSHLSPAIGVARAADEGDSISPQQRARFRARLAATPGAPVRPRVASRSAHTGSTSLSRLVRGLARHRHALSSFQRVALTQVVVPIAAGRLVTVAVTPIPAVAPAPQGAVRARSPPLS